MSESKDMTESTSTRSWVETTCPPGWVGCDDPVEALARLAALTLAVLGPEVS